MVLKWLATEIFRSNCIFKEFSNDFQKTNMKIISPTNYNRSTHRDELIRIPSNFLQLAQSAGKITRIQGANVMI